MTDPFTHGQDVIVLDRRGNHEVRGKIMGVHRCNPWQYDVQPRGKDSLSERVCGIPHEQLRPVGKPILAYEKQECAPKHIFDEA